VQIVGKVLDQGEGETREGGAIYWLKLYQSNGGERPGETADIWTREPLPVKHGELVVIDAAVRAEGDRLKIMGAKLAPAREGAA
jgi:hypothetical protein